MKFLGGGTKICMYGVKIQVTVRGGRCLGEKIEYSVNPICRLRQQKPAATKTGQHRLTTQAAHIAPSAASNALPPSSSNTLAAPEVSLCPDATTPKGLVNAWLRSNNEWTC